MSDNLTPGTTLYAANLVDGRVVVEERTFKDRRGTWLDVEWRGETKPFIPTPNEATVGVRLTGDVRLYLTAGAAKAGLVERLRVERDRAYEVEVWVSEHAKLAERHWRAALEQVEGIQVEAGDQ